MRTGLFFALQELKPIDPDIEKIFLYVMGILFVVGLGVIAWHTIPLAVSYFRNKHTKKIKTKNDIWFDVNESLLHCGHKQVKLERKSIEYYVCEITFSDPFEYHDDADIFVNFDHVKSIRGKGERGVYQAVNRLNGKVASSLGLNNLFKYDKNGTTINSIYRQHIIDES